jgi:hypothetical protein
MLQRTGNKKRVKKPITEKRFITKRSILAVFSFLALTFLAYAPSNAHPHPPPLPEPFTFELLGIGLTVLAVYKLIRKRRK